MDPELEELQKAFEEHHAAVKAGLDEIPKVKEAVDDLISKTAALSVGGSGDPADDGRKAKLELEAFGCLCAKGALDEKFTAADLSVVVDREGGFTALPEVDTQVQRKLRDISPMRRICEVRMTTAGEYKRLLNVGGTASGWVGEKQSRPQTDADTYNEITIPVCEIYTMPAVSQLLLDDSFANVADEVITSITDEFSDQENAAFVTGDGLKKPKGLLSYDKVTTGDATRPEDELQYIASGAAGAFPDQSGVAGAKDPDSLISLVYAVRAPYRNGANWLMNSTTAATLAKFKDGEGRLIWRESVAAGQPPMLLGYPVEISEDMPDIASDAYPIAFGNFRRGYLIVDRTGIRVLRDPYSDKGKVLFYTTKRVGGGLTDSDAIKLLKMAAS